MTNLSDRRSPIPAPWVLPTSPLTSQPLTACETSMLCTGSQSGSRANEVMELGQALWPGEPMWLCKDGVIFSIALTTL